MSRRARVRAAVERECDHRAPSTTAVCRRQRSRRAAAASGRGPATTTARSTSEASGSASMRPSQRATAAQAMVGRAGEVIPPARAHRQGRPRHAAVAVCQENKPGAAAPCWRRRSPLDRRTAPGRTVLGTGAVRNSEPWAGSVEIGRSPRFPCRLVDAALALRLQRWIEYRCPRNTT